MDDQNNDFPMDDSGEPQEHDYDALDATDAKEAFAQFHAGSSSTEETLERYSHCVLCDAHLHFTYLTDFSKNRTQEVARCPECGIRIRRLNHQLQ